VGVENFQPPQKKVRYHLKILSKEKIYSGPIFDLTHQTIELPNGAVVKRDVLVHNGAAMIIAVTNEGNLIMVRQHRAGTNALTLEFPAGKLDPPEEPQDCALRELEEETGYKANKIRLLHKFFPVAAYCTEQISMFLAEDLTPGKTAPDSDEFVEIEIYSLDELLKMLENGEIIDMKTVMGILYYARLVGK